MSPLHTALVSDDLTGALDSAVPFARAGWYTVVATDLSALDRAIATGAEVVAVSLNSREIAAPLAADRARQAGIALSKVPFLFKKIDSRMKGHIGAETRALAVARGAGQMVVCPAIPELDRIVVGGHVMGHGIATPIPVGNAFGYGGQVTCPDARNDADLDAIVATAAGALLVGARGLASALARQRGQAGRTQGGALRLQGPMGFVIGSRDETTLAQVASLRRDFPAAHWVGAPDGQMTAPCDFGPLGILQATDGGGGADGATVSARLAAAMADQLQAGRKTLLLTGGETAAACLGAMGISLLHLLGEVQPGLPVSLPLDFPDAPHIVTKSGGFGDRDCLSNLARRAMDQSRVK